MQSIERSPSQPSFDHRYVSSEGHTSYSNSNSNSTSTSNGNGSGGNHPSSEQLPTVVLQYLYSQGFYKAAKELQQEIEDPSHQHKDKQQRVQQNDSGGASMDVDAPVAPHSDSILTQGKLDLKHFEENLIILGICGGNMQLYLDSYESLRSWVSSSIEIARMELYSVLFPVFAQCYVTLIRYNKFELAKAFWRKYSGEHQLIYHNELMSLSTLVDPTQLQNPEERYLRALQLSKYQVPISQFALDLLMSFLIGSELRLISAIINDHLHFDRHNSAPATVVKPATLQGYAAPTATTGDSLPKVDWAVPSSLTALGESQLLRTHIDHFRAALPDTRSDETYDAWVSHLVRPNAVWQEIQGLSGTKLSGSGNNLTHSHRGSAGTAPKGRSDDPTAVFATVTNAYDGAICLNITPDVMQAAAGFRDSCVRVWRIESRHSRSSGAAASKVLSKATEQDLTGTPFNRLLETSDGTNRGSRFEVLPARGGAGHTDNSGGSGHNSSDYRTSNSNSTGNSNSNNYTLQLRGHRGPVYGVDQDESGRLVLSGSADETVRLWDTHVGQCVGKYSLESAVCGVAWHPLGHYYFAAALMDGSLQVLSTDSTSSSPLRVMLGHVSDVTCCQWHPNGSLVATGSDDKTVRLWDLRSGNCVRLFQGPASGVTALACSPFGNHVAAGTELGTIHLWDVGSGRSVAALRGGHTDTVNSVAFSHDGDVIASGAEDCTVRVWDLKGLKPTINAVFAGHEVEEVMLRPRHNFFTKFTPVHFVRYSAANMIYAGGPFSAYRAANAPSMDVSLAEATEKEAAMALGLAHPVPSI